MAYRRGITLQCDYARSNAHWVAAAASLGYITTRRSPCSSIFEPVWRITRAGLAHLERHLT